MTTLVKDLINFEEVEEVIKIRKEEKAKEYIEKYVITDSLRRNLGYMFDILGGATHKSFNVVGNYGTGKSHFLAFVSSLLEHPDYRSLVKDKEISQKAQSLGRRYLVVKFELGAAKEVSLRYIFFDQIHQQLLSKYDIEVRKFDLDKTYDNKQAVLDILSDIKAGDPEAGLVVVVDEISDFLKQKAQTEMAYDLALLRELGEVSQDSDFLYIGAMQEHVFTNAKYVSQAESIARINQRFVTVTITKDDVSQVLTSRVLNKNASQRSKLDGLLADHRKYFPNFAAQADKYINLFPIHPYVIEVFEQLPYFENRGIIGFAVQNVKQILNEPAPIFITYDRVFDLIYETHEIRNQPDVAAVVNVVNTLQAKVDLLDERYREDAKKLIKALAVLKMLGGQNQNGATSQELANTLMITPPGKMLVEPEMARDNIERIMKNIREVTVGQYIDYGEGRYYLNLAKIDDYDAYIDQKAQAEIIDNPAEIEETFKNFVVSELGIKGQPQFIIGKFLYADTTAWTSHRSYRTGLLVLGQDEGMQAQFGDYRFVLQGPRGSSLPTEQNEVLLSVEFPNEVLSLLIRARAAEKLANEGVHKKIMTQLSKEAYTSFGEKYMSQLVTQGYVFFAGHKTELAKLQSQRPLNTLNDLIEHVKSAVLEGAFKEKYPNHPTFNNVLTAQNITSEMTRTLQNLERQATVQLDMNSQGYLASFGAMKDGHFSASSSPVCQLILERIEANDAKNKLTPIEDIIGELGREPWGLHKEMVLMLLGAMLFNGYLIFVRQGGSRLHANDVAPLVKNGLEFFNDIRYLERDKDIDTESVVEIFNSLQLQAGLVRDKDSRSEAVKVLHEKGGILKAQISQLKQSVQTIIAEAANFPGLPWLAIQDLMGRLAWLDKPIAQFAEVSKVADLGKIDSGSDFRAELKNHLADLEVLAGFVTDWNEQGLRSGLQRMFQAISILPKLTELATSKEKASIDELERIAADSKVIYTDPKQMLDASLRRPLKGKCEQFSKKYDQAYFGMHRRIVGEEAPWEKLAAIRQGKKYTTMNQLKNLPFISSAPFNQMALDIQNLERRRCNEFTALTMATHVSCPYCRFPEEGQIILDLPSRVKEIDSRLEGLWASWESQILSELPGLKSRLALLSPSHKKDITALERAGKLPESVSSELVAALYELTSELQAVEIDLQELGDFLMSRGSALTEDEMRSALDEYLLGLLKGHDRSLVRFKMVHKESEA